MFFVIVLFPDSSEPSKVNGGERSQESLRNITLDRLGESCNREPHLIAKSSGRRVRDYLNGKLQEAFPLQFPYGYGERNPDENGSSGKTKSKVPNPDSYYKWLMKLSLPNMHRADFVLVVHNMFERNRAVSTSWMRGIAPHGAGNYGELFAEMDSEELQMAAKRRDRKDTRGTTVEETFFQCMDAVSRSLAHSNEAAMKARADMFAKITRFGLPALFFTVTPDDQCNFRIQIMKFGEMNVPGDFRSCESSEVEATYESCAETRIKLPGLCSIDFNSVLQLLIRHVLGWDTITKQSHHGAFGKIDAFYGAVEEQARKTLHVHFIVWLEDWNELLNRLYSGDDQIRNEAALELGRYIEKTLSCKLNGKDCAIEEYQHTCNESAEVDIDFCQLQDLRNLRAKKGKSSFGDRNIAKCRICGVKFSSETIALNKLNQFGFNDNDGQLSSRLQLFIASQVLKTPVLSTNYYAEEMISYVTHYIRNLHRSEHASSCFKKGNGECRFLIPKQPSIERTKVTFRENCFYDMNEWNGVQGRRAPFELNMKRAFSDVYVNTNHSPTSISLGCNSNLQVGIDGRHIIYCTLYTGKSTQQEDSSKYSNISKQLAKYIKKQQDNMERTNEISSTPFDIGFRRLLGAVLSNSSAHVISATLASFIIREGSRFVKSHECVCLPLPSFMSRDIVVKLQTCHQRSYLSSQVFNYQFRPLILESLCAYDFFEQFEMKRLQKKDDTIMHFIGEHSGKNLHGVKKRDHAAIPILGFSDFINSAKFEGHNILTYNVFSDSVSPESLNAMIKYSKQVLMIFVPWRSQEVLEDRSCIMRFQEAFRSQTLKPRHVQMLTNMQQCYNSLGNPVLPDSLQCCTIDSLQDSIEDKEANKEKLNELIMEEMTEIAAILSETLFGNDNEHVSLCQKMTITLSKLRDKGAHKCGYSLLKKPSYPLGESLTDISVLDEASDVASRSSQLSMSNEFLIPNDNCVTYDRLFSLAFRCSSRNVAHIGTCLSSVVADGSYDSIIEWADIAFKNEISQIIDEHQKRAFQVIISSFILTYIQEAEVNREKFGDGLHRRERSFNIKWKKSLMNLRGRGIQDQSQLIGFLSGPGGSGKSHVITMVLQYAKEYTRLLKVSFTKRTIVVTAMTGVAATAIRGETIHSAAGLFQKQTSIECVKEWQDTRLLILDEISFASKDILEKLHEKLGELTENRGSKYGGINVVFAGDFAQLEPISGKPLYADTDFRLWHDAINCFLPLEGNHRFAKDPLYGDIMYRFREGVPTKQDFDVLNSRVLSSISSGKVKPEDMPDGVTHAVYRNSDRDAINNGIFYHHIKSTHSKDSSTTPPDHTIMIKAGELKWKRGREHISRSLHFNTSFQNVLFNECGADNIESHGFGANRRIDPLLKLHVGMPLMFTVNADVANGVANGTLCFLRKVKLKPSIASTPLPKCNVDGFWVNTVCATDVEYLVCQHAQSEEIFHVEVECNTQVRAKIPFHNIFGIPMKKTPVVNLYLSQFPVLVNYACTGHKLQGQTKETLCVSAWSYTKNWPYVALSRVSSLQGLYLRLPLSADPCKYAMSPKLKRMLQRFASKIPSPVDNSIFFFNT
jgi:PIF1-like helicase/Helitron helicase-like domain at N-terminus